MQGINEKRYKGTLSWNSRRCKIDKVNKNERLNYENETVYGYICSENELSVINNESPRENNRNTYLQWWLKYFVNSSRVNHTVVSLAQ